MNLKYVLIIRIFAKYYLVNGGMHQDYCSTMTHVTCGKNGKFYKKI